MDTVKFLDKCDYTITPIANAFTTAGLQASGIFGGVAPYIEFMTERKGTHSRLYYPYVSLICRCAEFGVAVRDTPSDYKCLVSADFAARKVTVNNLPCYSNYESLLTERYKKSCGIMSSQADVLSLSCLVANELLVAVRASDRFKPEHFIDGVYYKHIPIPNEKVELSTQELMEALL